MKATKAIDLRVPLLVCLLMLNGCSKTPPAVKHVLPSGSKCAGEALDLYDNDGDGALNAEELKSCPGLQAAVDRVDVDHDQKLSAAEIAKRIDDLRASTAAVMTTIVVVRRGGAPLSGAQIVVEPEPFLEGLPVPAVGVTDARGEITLSGQDAKIPGLYCGMYRVRVSKQQQGRETIPARYNTQTTLGFELARDVPSLREKIQFDLKQ